MGSTGPNGSLASGRDLLANAFLVSPDIYIDELLMNLVSAETVDQLMQHVWLESLLFMSLHELLGWTLGVLLTTRIIWAYRWQKAPIASQILYRAGLTPCCISV